MDSLFIAFGAAVIASLVTCVIFLFRLCVTLGRSLDEVRQHLGRMEGIVTALSVCPGGTPCPYNGRLPNDFQTLPQQQDNHTS